MSSPETAYWKRILADQNVTSQDKVDAKTVIALENVDNTTDAQKPVSTAQQTALDAKVPTSRTVNGLTLDNDIAIDADAIDDTATANKFATQGQLDKVDFLTVTGSVDLDEIKTKVATLDQAIVLIGTWDASSGSFPGAGAAQAGYCYIVDTAGTVDTVSFLVGDRVIAIVDNASTSTYDANWIKSEGSDLVSSVAGKTGAVTLDSSDVGLGNVNNTSDANKPVSTAQQTEINNKTLANAITSITSASSPYSASYGETIHCDTTSGAITVTPPAASTHDGEVFAVVLKTVGAGNSVDVGSFTLDVAGESGIFKSNGTDFDRY